jgi:Leucine-rich repeat (LRR) protein
MTPAEDYAEALRRIRETKETGALELDLSGLALNLVPRELAHLSSLQTLYLSECAQLSGDLTSLASLTSLQSLDLFECRQLSGDLGPLAGLTSLESLNLLWCQQLSGDLGPLAGLTSLKTLNLGGQLSGDLGPLAGLTSLKTLSLNHCLGIRQFASLASLLPTLKELYLFGCKLNDLPAEVCGENSADNVLNKVSAHYADLADFQYGARRDC